MKQNGIKDYRIVIYNMMAIIVSHLSASRHFGFVHHTVRIRSVTREGDGGERGGGEREGGGRRRRRK